MSNHTPEPWFTDETFIGSSASDQLNSGYFTADCIGPDAAANARRIVACVNACKGLDTEDLDRNGLVSAVGYELIELTKQRDELLAAANAVMEWWEEHQYDCDGDYNRYSDDPEFVMLAREAIAKAKGGAA